MNFWKYLFRRRLNQDLDEEIESHLRMAAEDHRDRGDATDEARLAARREFGNAGLVKETTRDAWGWTWLETLIGDTRHALRLLRKNPGWSAAVVLSIALGVGANTAIFSLTYAVLLKSLPVPDPSQLVRYTFVNGSQDIGLSWPAYDSLRHHQTAATDLLAWGDTDLAFSDNGQVETVKGALLSGNGFDVLDLQPTLGTHFNETNDVRDGGPGGYRALLSYSWWTTRFGAREDVVGKPLMLNGRTVTVIGVLPPGFEGLMAGRSVSVILPLSFRDVLSPKVDFREQRGAMWLTVMGRLKPGQSLASAQSNLKAVEPTVRNEADPQHLYLDGFFRPFHFGVEDGRSGRSFLRRAFERPLLVLEMLVGLLLVLCAANTGLLVLAQVGGRRREFALRGALGASRGRTIRQVLLEVLLLAIPGLALAVGLGWALAQSLVTMLDPLSGEVVLDVTPNTAVLAFSAVVTLAAALAAGLTAAIRASRVDPVLGLRQTGAAGASKRAGVWVVPVQVALSVSLVVSSLLLAGSFLRLYTRDAGFRGSQLVLANVDLQPAHFTATQSTTAARQIAGALADTPGMTNVAVMSVPPLFNWFSAGDYYSIDARGALHPDMTVWPELVSPGYFPTMGTRLLRGRTFPANARPEDGTCVLSESAARYFFPQEDPIGRFIYAGTAKSHAGVAEANPKNAWRVIGVVQDARFRSLREPAPRMVYQIFDADQIGAQFTVAVRSADTERATIALREAVRRVAPSVPAPKTLTFTGLVDAHLAREQMLIRLSGSFAVCALLLTAFGLFGLLMRMVVQTTPEIGVRMALGAQRSQIIGNVLRGALGYVAVGLAAGSVLAWVATRALASLLYGIKPHDPVAFAAGILVILLVALVAVAIPARRAASVDPMRALRTE